MITPVRKLIVPVRTREEVIPPAVSRRIRRGGFILISLYMVLVVLLIHSVALITHALAAVRMAQRSQASMQALYISEGGVDWAISQLRANDALPATLSDLGNGNYSVWVQDALIPGSRWRVRVDGQVTTLGDPVTRQLEVIVQQVVPAGFYDNVIWAAAEIDFNGTAYEVNGDVMHADQTPSGDLSGVNGTISYNPSAAPLPSLRLQQLYDIAVAQGNLYDADRLSGGAGVFPDSFWFTPPTDPADPATGVPNVNFITADLILNGNIGTIGGFFVVVGSVLSDPSGTGSGTLNGNGQVEGLIYSSENFRINGGGNGLNINGGVWVGHEVRLNGHATLTYESDYMQAIGALDLSADVQVISWRELDS